MDSLNKLTLVFLLLYSSLSYSSAQLQVDFKASNFQQLLKTNTGVLASVKYSARNNAGRAVYGLRTSSLSKSIVGNVLKNRSFSPWGIGLQVAITAAGYYLNSSTGEVETTQPDIGQYVSEIGQCRIFGQTTTNSTFSDCIARNALIYDPLIYDISYRLKSDGSSIEIILDNISLATRFTPSTTVIPITNYNDFLSTPAVNATDEEVYDAVVPAIGDSELAGYLKDPFTGKPDKGLTPLADAGQDLTDDYDAENDGDPSTSADTDSEYDNGEETFTEDPTELPNEELEDSTDEETDQCKLTPDALGCQEFGSELTSVDIPTEELTFSFNPISLASNTACPAPSVIALTFGNLSLSNQPLCDFLAGINTIVIAVCTILAVYILTGGVKNG